MAANTVIEQSPGTIVVTNASVTPNVNSVNGKTGTISLAASDVSAPSLAQLAAVGAGNGAYTVGYEQPMSNAVPLTAQAKLSQLVSVKDFGATGGGVTDDTIAISLADASAQAAGKSLWFPAGTYLVAQGTIAMSGTSWYGEGMFLSVIKVKSATFSALQSIVSITSKNNFTIQDIGFDISAATLTAGSVYSALQLTTCNNWQVRRCAVLGIQAYVLGISVNGGLNFDISQNYFNMPTPSGNQNEGINVSIAGGQAGNYTVCGNVLNGTGMYVEGSQGTIAHNIVQGFKFGGGITINTPPTASVCNRVIGNYVANGAGLDSNSTYCLGIENWSPYTQIIGNLCIGNSGHGIANGAQFCVITGNVCLNNGQSAPSNGAGIYGQSISTSSHQNCLIANNLCTDTQTTKTQTYGYREFNVSGTVAYNYIHDNNFDHNLTGTTLLVSNPVSWRGPSIFISSAMNPGTVANATTITTTYSVTGVTLGDNVRVGFGADNQGCSFFGYVSASGQVTVSASNNTGASKTFTSNTINIWVEKPPGYTSLS